MLIRKELNGFRGSEEDVSHRLVQASKAYELDYFVNMTADCPLVPYDLIGNLITTFQNTNADLVSCYELPVGIYLSGINPPAMERLNQIKSTNISEYWLNYFLKTNLFNVVPLIVDKSLLRTNYRFALDYPEDYKFLKLLYEGLGKDAYKATTKEIISYVDSNPDLIKINFDCNRKMMERSNLDPNSQVKIK